MINGLGEKLANLRAMRNLSQPEVANALGISKSSVGEYEVSAVTPSAEVMLKLATFYGVSLDYLYGLEDNVKIDLGDLSPELQASFLNILGIFKKLNDQL